jgi:hypothetical protein
VEACLASMRGPHPFLILAAIRRCAKTSASSSFLSIPRSSSLFDETHQITASSHPSRAGYGFKCFAWKMPSNNYALIRSTAKVPVVRQRRKPPELSIDPTKTTNALGVQLVNLNYLRSAMEQFS